jgi:hypothetical protein
MTGILRATVPLLGVLLVLIGLAVLSGRGEDPAEALLAYVPYLPDSVIPSDLACHSMSEYPGAYGEICTLEAVPYCQRGYLVVQDSVITYTRWIGCDFPAAYLMAQYGRPTRITHFRRVVMLLWDGFSAQIRRTGWFASMQAVSSAGWCRWCHRRRLT